MFEYIHTFMRSDNHSFAKNLLIFAGMFLGVFVVSYVALGALGFIPTEFQSEVKENIVVSQINSLTPEKKPATPAVAPVRADASAKTELPYRIVASSINLDTTIVHPASANYTVLNNALVRGPVYYPGSGTAGKGNMFVFGHSTSYQYVNNKAFQVFNNVKNLRKGDEIKVYGKEKVYLYKVREVKLVNANQELVSFSTNENILTLSTCNSFGQKSDRYVAEADFISSHTI